MSYDKEFRATVALLGGSMTTLSVPIVHTHEVEKRSSNRTKSSDSSGRSKRNSALGFFNIFNRKEKGQSAVYHSENAEWPQSSYSQSTPSLSSHFSSPLPYPVQPPPPIQPAELVLAFAIELSWADDVHRAFDMADQQTLPFYDDCKPPSGMGDESDSSSSPEFTYRQSSLIRRQVIRRNKGSKKHSNNSRSSKDFPETSDTLGGKLLRSISTPSSSTVDKKYTDVFDNNDGGCDYQQPEEDTPIPQRPQPSTTPCPNHNNMSQYFIHFFFFPISCLPTRFEMNNQGN